MSKETLDFVTHIPAEKLQNFFGVFLQFHIGVDKVQQSAMEVDERVGMVEEYLNALLPTDWDNMDLYQRRNFLQGSEFGQPDHKGTVVRTEVSNPEIWCECFGKNLQELKPSDSYAIAALMSQISGWERTNSIKRQPIYGRQRLYKFGG